jgi:DNA replication protein DnaC
MERINIPRSLQKRMAFHSDYCDQHRIQVQKMVVNGSVVCPRCELDKDQRRLENKLQEHFDTVNQREQYNTLSKKSILEDQTLVNARFKTFKTVIDEEVRNKSAAVDHLHRYKDGETFNTILQGKPGSGKSHLSYSILWELNEKRTGACLFINIQAMIRKIKDSFNNKESKHTEEYFVTLLSDVDFLVLDDLGAETGAIDSDKAATDFVQRILYAVTTVRQNKATIITTNLSGQKLFSMYDEKLVSRLFKRPKYIIFKETTDKRIADIPF